MPSGAVHTNKHSSGLGGRDTGRVLWIVGSTDRHLVLLLHPGINALERYRASRAALARCS
jgi:hypothetical protein